MSYIYFFLSKVLDFLYKNLNHIIAITYIMWYTQSYNFFRYIIVTIYTSSQARAKLFTLIDETNKTHEPIYIKGKRNNAVIISEEDYEGLQETLYLYSIPGLVKRILEASKEPLEECISHEEAWK